MPSASAPISSVPVKEMPRTVESNNSRGFERTTEPKPFDN
jgi:hypothetical protein